MFQGFCLFFNFVFHHETGLFKESREKYAFLFCKNPPTSEFYSKHYLLPSLNQQFEGESVVQFRWSMYFFYWGSQSWTQHSRYGQQRHISERYPSMLICQNRLESFPHMISHKPLCNFCQPWIRSGIES